jgi:hypothetical protein
VMRVRIMRGRSIPSECPVVEVTTIREGREFEERIEKLKDAKEFLSYDPVKI